MKLRDAAAYRGFLDLMRRCYPDPTTFQYSANQYPHYFGYNVSLRRYEYLDGRVRYRSSEFHRYGEEYEDQ